MKLRSFFYSLAASVLVLLLISGGVFFWIAVHSPLTLLQGEQLVPEAVMFVPRHTPLIVSLLVNPDRLGAFRQVMASPQIRRQSRTEFNQLRQSLTASLGLDYQTDIQPWLGEEITFAVTTLDIDRQGGNGRQPGYLLALDIRDPEQSQAFLQRFWQKQALSGKNFVSEQYQGVKLTHTEFGLLKAKQPSNSSQSINLARLDPDPKSFATARVGDRFILLANHPKVLRQAINNVQAPDLGLGNTSQYQRVLSTLHQGRIGFTFLNLPQLLAWNSPHLPTYSSHQSSSLAIDLGLNRNGLLAETALISPSRQDINSEPGVTLPLLSNPVQALQYLPADTPLAISGAGLNQLWSQISAAFVEYDLTAKLVNQPLDDLKTRWKLDLPQDIFAWVKGEYAIGMVPRSLDVHSSEISNPDWLFIAERTEPEVVQAAMEHVDTTAKQQGLDVGSIALEGQEVLTWTQLLTAVTDAPVATLRKSDRVSEALPTLPESRFDILRSQVVGAHTEVGNYQILANSLEGVSLALKAKANSLANSDHFKQAIAPLPQPNGGYVYLDWAGSRPLLEQQFPLLQAIEVLGNPLFSHLDSLALSSYGAEAGVYRSQVFIKLGS